MPDDLTRALNMAKAFIGIRSDVTDDDILNAVNAVHSAMPGVDSERVRDMLLECYTTRITDYKILDVKESRKPWLKAFKASSQSEWPFWQRYKYYLEQKKSFSAAVIEHIDTLTDDILDHLFNPRIPNIVVDKKGLVVGQVQSGKTANYTALICKAVDAGFNFIIVLAGIHNNLRSQTQTRLDEGFLGFDTHFGRKFEEGRSTKTGVGLVPGFQGAIAHSLTTSDEKGDFTKKGADSLGINFDTTTPILMVVKKNASVLKRLNSWLQTYAGSDKIRNKAVLIIDDEADHASINTNRHEFDPTRINGFIRTIIGQFSRTAYVGYTATPYANIFIPLDDTDLFPKDFIINLPAPDNYIGPEKVFGISPVQDEQNEDVLPIVNIVDDYARFVPTGHKKDDRLPVYADIPESLKTAVKCFIMTCAIRIVRGQENKHNSMLIHITRYQRWQNEIKALVECLFNYYKNEIVAKDPTVLEEFRKILEEDGPGYKSYKTVSAGILNSSLKDVDKHIKVHSWEEVKDKLYAAVQKIEVKSINGSSGDVLSYYENEETGISIIAIGGDKLSRGLTLEGLSVSYFLRASKMYDTLMQMGRWFGYRPGYVDLCRLYTSDELDIWFRHITIASEELREEFNYLAEIGSTPDNYALKVRSHPGTLQVTSLAKMRYTKQIQVSWATRLVETYQLQLDKEVKTDNLINTEDFLSGLGDYEPRAEGQAFYLWKNVLPEQICDYLEKFKVGKELKKVDFDLICKYIRELNLSGELNSWNVGLMSRDHCENGSEYTFNNGIHVNNYTRSNSRPDNPDTYFIIKNHIVGNRTDEFIDMDNDTLERALARTIELKQNSSRPWTHTYPAPDVVRAEFREPSHPLLLVYPLNPAAAKSDMFSPDDAPFIGLVIAFPRTNRDDIACSYVCNQVEEFEQDEENFENDNDNTYGRD